MRTAFVASKLRISQSTPDPDPPSPNVLTDTEFIRTLLIKRWIRLANRSRVGAATLVRPPGANSYPRNVKPRTIRPIKVLSGCCSTFNARSVAFTTRIAARNFQRVGASTTQSSIGNCRVSWSRGDWTPVELFCNGVRAECRSFSIFEAVDQAG